MKIGIGADHKGFRLKCLIIRFLKEKKYEVKDYGIHSVKSVDYPKIALQLAQDLVKKKMRFGILLCYTGQGMAMAANKVKGIRAAICTKPEIAKLTRAHNNANILVLPAGFLKFAKNTQKIIETFINSKFEGGRHLRRIKIIKRYEASTHRI